MSLNARSVRTALLAIALFALVVAAAPRVLQPEVSGAVDTVADHPGDVFVQHARQPVV